MEWPARRPRPGGGVSTQARRRDWGARALVIAPDPVRARVLALQMRDQGYRPSIAPDASAAIARVRSGPPDLVLIDPPDSEPSGAETARAVSRVAPLARLYVLATDPMRDRRVRAIRVEPAPAAPEAHAPWTPTTRTEHLVEAGDLRIDHRDDDATIGGIGVGLTPLEFRLLWALAASAGAAMDRDAIHDSVWGGPLGAGSRAVDVLVRRLRRKVDECGGRFTYVQTVPGVGYRFEAVARGAISA